MSRRRKIQFAQWLGITVAWLMIAVLVNVYDHLLLHGDYVEALSSRYSFLLNLFFNIQGALVGALLGGSFLVFYANEKFRDKPYWYSIATVTIVYFIVFFIVNAVQGFLLVPSDTGISIGDPAFVEAYRKYLFNNYHPNDVLLWLVVVALTQFYLQMNSKFGNGVLWDIIWGKYHLPRAETRIFMFADLNSSTAIAEKLGAERYHELLKDFFSDITNPIIDNRGDIYQYIGDEVVIAWKYENGIAGNQCIQCFFDMKKQIEKHSEHYMNEYGLIPTFKAGIHFGKVIAGEIGIIKRDITFSGDVLNTASRIQSKCKEFEVEVIASDELLSNLSFKDKFISRPLGYIKLRGKEKEMGLSTLLLRV